MADTLPNVPLPKGVPVDLYSATGIIVGTRIIVQNLSGAEVNLTAKATAPTFGDGFFILKRSQEAENEIGDSGAWAVCNAMDGLVQVREA